MQGPNLNLTKEDYQQLVAILDVVEIKGRKSAEYIAVLAMKLELRIKNWSEKHPSGFDVISTETYEADVKETAKALADKAIADRDREILNQPAPIRAGYEQDT